MMMVSPPFILSSFSAFYLKFKVKAEIPVDPLSPLIRLVELRKYFPLAKGR